MKFYPQARQSKKNTASSLRASSVKRFLSLLFNKPPKLLYSSNPLFIQQPKEYENVGKPMLALDTLRDIIRRHKTWTKTHEQIMIKFIDLAISLRKGRVAKDGLHQYKNITNQTSISSLEIVIRHFLRSSESRVENALKEARGDDNAVLDVEDLEEAETPETYVIFSLGIDV